MNVLEQGEFRIVFSDGATPGFHLEVLENGKWRIASAANNALVSGPSFDLRPSDIHISKEGLNLNGINTLHGYRWSAHIQRAGTQWIKVDITIDSEGFTLGKIGGIEPEIVLDLGLLPPYERGDHVWFKVNIDNPTKWNDEARSTSFNIRAGGWKLGFGHSGFFRHSDSLTHSFIIPHVSLPSSSHPRRSSVAAWRPCRR